MFIECNQNEVICAMGTQVMSTFYRLPLKQGDNIQGHNIDEINGYCILLLLIDLFYAINVIRMFGVVNDQIYNSKQITL